MNITTFKDLQDYKVRRIKEEKLRPKRTRNLFAKLQIQGKKFSVPKTTNSFPAAFNFKLI